MKHLTPIILLFLAGCVHTIVPPVHSDGHINSAIHLSNCLDAKAVVVTEWLQSH